MRRLLLFSITATAVVFLQTCGFVEETAFISSSSSPPGPQWWNDAWSHRVELVLDNSAQSEDLFDFPVCVRLDSSRILYAETQDTGNDLRFIDSGQNVLAYEIETWDESGESFVWVKTRLIAGGSNTESVWLYYGNPEAPEGQDAFSVWSNGYETVLHLDETSGSYEDSTGNGHAGEAINGVSRGAPGRVGRCAELDGSDDYIALDMSYSGQGAVPLLTVNVWFRTTFAGSAYNDNWAFVDFDRSDFYDFYVTGDTGSLEFSTTASSGGTDDFVANTVGLNDGTWRLAWAVYDGTDKHIYLMDSLDGTSSNPHSGAGFGSSSTRWGFVGDGSEATTYDGTRNNIYYEGALDEVRISHVARSEDWISAQYLSMTDGFITYGTEQSR
ncbi:MAG: DUF2341 domain-containing protein [Spirochaetes bacterium]|nr:DUF2341 domain-containing protein [Spirochaetota bacterium]